MNVLSADLGEIRDSSARSGRSRHGWEADVFLCLGQPLNAAGDALEITGDALEIQWAAARVTTAKVSDDVLHVPRPMCGVWPVRARECA
jgi:hypothetical protein